MKVLRSVLSLGSIAATTSAVKQFNEMEKKMKKLLILGTLALMTSNAFAVGVAPLTVMAVKDIKNETGKSTVSQFAAFSSVLAITAGAATNPVAGLVVFAKNGTAELDLNNEETIDEIEAIQIAIEEGFELSDFQNSFLTTGMNAGQLDIDGTILE